MPQLESHVRQPAADSLLRAAARTPAAPDRLQAGEDPFAAAQRSVGNQALQRLLSGAPVQAQMVVGPADDEHEREAEEMADVVQRAPAGPSAKEPKREDEERKVVRRAPSTAGAPVVSPAVEQGIARARGGGQPLAAADRARFEPHLGHDLSGVRLHTDPGAAGLARDLNAEAFTTGPDVFFGEGRYRPGASTGDRLLAHELTHTVQQTGGRTISRLIQRQGQGAATGGGGTGGPTVPAPLPAGGTGDNSIGVVYPAQQLAILPSVKVPSFKRQRYGKGLYDPTPARPLRRNYTYNAASRPNQRADWRRDVARTPSEALLTQTVTRALPPGQTFNASTKYTFLPPAGGTRLYTVEQAAREFRLPGWNREGIDMTFEVDHLRELQLADWPDPSAAWANTRDNWALLEEGANGQSGTSLRSFIYEATRNFCSATGQQAVAARQAAGLIANPTPSQVAGQAGKLRRTHHVQFRQSVAEAFNPAVTPQHFWTIEEIEAGQHLANVRLQNLTGPAQADMVEVFPHPDGGPSQLFSAPNAAPGAGSPGSKLLAPLVVTAASFTLPATPTAGQQIGSLTVGFPANHKIVGGSGTRTLSILNLGGAARIGYVDGDQLLAALTAIQVKGASPVEITEFGVGNRGVHILGRLLPSVEPIRRANIMFSLEGDDLTIFKTFSLGEIEVPRPLTIDDVTLTLFASTERGLGAEGEVYFGIERVGSGQLSATISTGGGFAFEGRFFFDTELFTRAEIGVRWRDGRWSGDGVLEIGEGKVPGIRSARATVAYEPGRLHAEGTAELSVPGLQQGSLTIDYSDEEGIAIGGSFQLANTIPGIRGGTARALVRQRPDGTYSVTAHGEAQPAIPGVDANITVDYADGAITIEGRGAYSRGRLSGSVLLGATNRAIDPATGLPTGPPVNRLLAYGQGSATVQLTPWLQGTIGLRLLPNGEIVVTGSIGLPAALELFPAKTYDRNIFRIGLDIPILGVAAAGQRIGIFATVSGGLDLSASVGPGQLRELGLTITYNPDHEDQTRIEGGAQLYIPAQAGLRMFVRGGIGAGIPIVSATANLELGGRLGLEGALQAGVNVDWLANRGLVLDARAEIYVEPKLRFDVTASVLVEADLVLTTITLYEHRWELAAVEYGSNLRFGLALPIHYQEGQPFDVNWDDVEFQVPEISAGDVLSGLVTQIVG